jgi:hypothetical protein
MNRDFIENAATLTEQLRHLDRRRVVFGAGRHGYRFNACLSLQQVEAFESSHGIVLPTPYRRFLTELGNGGAGPYYGILPLELNLPELHQPFPFKEPYLVEEEDDEDSNMEVWEGEIPGSITIAEYGCGTYFLLIVQGELAGEIWVDARDETGIFPVSNHSNLPITFDAWWLRMMQRHLEQFQQVLALMEAETNHEEIHRRLDSHISQLDVDNMMLSIMDQDPTSQPKSYAEKPWGRVCGLVEDYYAPWLQARR